MNFAAAGRRLPRFLRRHILHFEALIEDAVRDFAGSLPESARVLDAGAGELQYQPWFRRTRYVAVDLAVGDAGWDYSRLDAIAHLSALPFPADSFEAALHIVTIEHLTDPQQSLREVARVLKPGGRLLLAAPLCWEVHQAPHDYYRYTVHGLRHLCANAGLTLVRIEPAGGFFRLLSRRLWNALQFFPGLAFPFALFVFAPPALLLPVLDGLDHHRNFTLGYLCIAAKL